MRTRWQVCALTSLLCAVGCGGGGGDGGGGGSNPTTILRKASPSGDGQSGTVATALANPLCVEVIKSGDPAAGEVVAWSTASGGSLGQPSTATGADGTACTTFTLGPVAGSQTATVTLAGASGSPLTFNLAAAADDPAQLLKNGGDAQQADIGLSLGAPLSVKIVDQFGNPVSAVPVSWMVTSGSATLNPLNGTTSGSGIANTTVTLGGTAGPVSMTASSGSLAGSPQSFSATARALPTAITISVRNSVFNPPVDTVAAGGTVTWDWATGAAAHDVVSTGATSFPDDPAGISDAPHTYGPITFSTPGIYFYYCTEHGSPGSPPTGMAGRIIVR
jgi:plastocyanin